MCSISHCSEKLCLFIQLYKVDGSFGFWVQDDTDGLYLEYVLPASSAELAGLHTGDRVLEINNVSTQSKTFLVERIIIGYQYCVLEEVHSTSIQKS